MSQSPGERLNADGEPNYPASPQGSPSNADLNYLASPPASPADASGEQQLEEGLLQRSPVYAAQETDYPASPQGSPVFSGHPESPASLQGYSTVEAEYPHIPSEYSTVEAEYPHIPSEYSPVEAEYPASPQGYSTVEAEYPQRSPEYSNQEPEYPASPQGSPVYNTGETDYPSSPPKSPAYSAQEHALSASPQGSPLNADAEQNYPASPQGSPSNALEEPSNYLVSPEASPRNVGTPPASPGYAADATAEHDSDEDDQEHDETGKDVGKLISNIFGDESDNEGDVAPEDGDVRAALQESEDEERDWDFDTIIAAKKKERSKKRKRRRDGSIDLCSNADGQIRHIVELMKNAATEDREANNQRRPAIQKTKLLEAVKSTLMRADFFEALCENDMMSAISEWLAPLPDKSLPSLEIRSSLLKILDGFPTLESGLLKQSGIGKAIMLITKHPKETKENRGLALKLIRNWSQPIFQVSADYSTITRDDREKFDMYHLPEVKRRRIEEKLAQGDSSKSSSSKKEDKTLGPGDKGFINRARVPQLSTSAYIIRPKPNVDGQFRGESKNFVNSRFDKTTRDFKDRVKGTKSQRIGVSIEGRRMEI